MATNRDELSFPPGGPLPTDELITDAQEALKRVGHHLLSIALYEGPPEGAPESIEYVLAFVSNEALLFALVAVSSTLGSLEDNQRRRQAVPRPCPQVDQAQRMVRAFHTEAAARLSAQGGPF